MTEQADTSDQATPRAGAMLPAERYRDEPEEKPIHEGPDAVRHGARELAEMRGPEPQTVNRRYGEDGPQTRTIRQAGEDLNLTRKVERAKDFVERGLSNHEAANAAVAPEIVDTVPGFGADDEPTSAREAARALAEWRAGKPQREAAAAIDGEAVEAETPVVELEQAEPEAPDPVEQQRQQELQRVQNERAAIELLRGLSQAEVLLHAQRSQAMSAFADIQTAEDYKRMMQNDPARTEKFWQAAQFLEATRPQMQQLAEQRELRQFQVTQADRAAEQKEFKDWYAQQAEVIEKETPELRDPGRIDSFKRAVGETIKVAGITEETLSDPHIRRALFSVEGQRLARDATYWREAQAKAKNINGNAKPLPPVQRPGVGQARGAADHARIASLEKRLNASPNGIKGARIAAQIVKARRVAAGR